MKITNGKILIFFGIIHPLLGISPFAFGKQFMGFAEKYFFKISEGLFEFPLLNGQMNYENFAAFWFFYFGLLLIPIGVLVNYVEKTNGQIPKNFIWVYLIVVLVGVIMIPFSGMTIFMLPHAIYMLIQRNKQPNKTKENEFQSSKQKTTAPARLYRMGKDNWNLDLPHDTIVRQRV